MVNEAKEKMQKARKGFTLVELLIVIIIIGILAGAMMLVAGTSRDAAEASKIISDLRNVKAAALMWMAENPNTVTREMWEAIDDDQSGLNILNKYLDRPLIEGTSKFIFDVVESDDYEIWTLGYNLSNARAGVKDNLKKQASSAGLYKPRGNIEFPLDSADFYNGESEVNVVVQ